MIFETTFFHGLEVTYIVIPNRSVGSSVQKEGLGGTFSEKCASSPTPSVIKAPGGCLAFGPHFNPDVQKLTTAANNLIQSA